MLHVRALGLPPSSKKPQSAPPACTWSTVRFDAESSLSMTTAVLAIASGRIQASHVKLAVQVMTGLAKELADKKAWPDSSD